MAFSGKLSCFFTSLPAKTRCNFDIVGDAEALPDLEIFAKGLRHSLGELGAIAAAPNPRDALSIGGSP